MTFADCVGVWAAATAVLADVLLLSVVADVLLLSVVAAAVAVTALAL